MTLRLYDAHNHLQDERFGGRQADLVAECERAGVARMVVNGSCEKDWQQVLDLSKRFGEAGVSFPAAAANTVDDARGASHAVLIVPSFGYHPWYIHERTHDWQEKLIHFLDQSPAAVGEIGLDRWRPGLDYTDQEDVFFAQLQIAAERNLPASIHCLQAWGRMLEILKAGPRPRCGFLLHSYGGPKEMVESFAELGAFFSLPGYYAHERKERQRETFRHIPPERLLIETDAPDQMLPQIQSDSTAARVFALMDEATGKPLNHPANLQAVYAFAAALLGESLELLAARVEENFFNLFGSVIRR